MELLILASVIGTLIGFIMGRIAKSKPRHAHIWKTLNSQTMYRYASTIKRANDRPTAMETQVLKGCFCGEVKVTVVEGHWKNEDIKSLEV